MVHCAGDEQMLLVLIQKRPPKGHRLFVVGTTSNIGKAKSLVRAGPPVSLPSGGRRPPACG